MKTPRQIAIADHLWEAFGRMAERMGSDRDALVNQAMHMFARLNGFEVPGATDRHADVTPRPTPALATPPPATPPPATPPPALPEPDRQAVAERVLETAARLERDVAERTPSPAAGKGKLVLLREDGTEAEVGKDRFLIGRGKHCDLVVDSGKVSREHAAVFREDGAWFIEDLGSSNGTWFRRERIGRRRIEDGDEYFVCSERIRCALR